jgi:hypothetical protein
MTRFNNDRGFETTEDKIRMDIETDRINKLQRKMVTEVFGLSGFEEQEAIKIMNNELMGGDSK